MQLHSENIWISGLGAISSIGMNVKENFESLKSGKDGVGKADFLQTIHRGHLPVCEVKLSNEDLASLAQFPDHLPRTTYLSAIAVQEALKDAEIDIANNPYRIGFLSGNTVGGMDTTELFFKAYLENQEAGHLRDVIHHECGSITELVARNMGLSSYFTTFSTACSSSANSIMQAARMIKHGRLDIAIAGGADALCKFTLNGFNTLMILDSNPCTPFDQERKGLNLGEGAGYVVLISDRVKKEMNAKVYAKLLGYANANDAFHQTASSAEGNGNFLAMSGALKLAGLSPHEIDYINLHGTGTANNDSSEGIAIQRLFGERIPIVSSTKANTGHTLGACGGLEAVYSCLAIQHQCVYPNLRFKNPMQELHFTPQTEFSNKTVNCVMSNSFGFGGNCSSLIFGKA